MSDTKTVVMLISVAGADVEYQPGTTQTLPGYIADAWVRAGHAEWPKTETSPDLIETATADPPYSAMIPITRRKVR